MARARNIKPGLFKNEVLGVADPLYTLLFEGLWLLADRAGRLEDRPLRIKAELFPYRDGLDMGALLGWLDANGFIRRYSVGGASYIQVVEFVKHQNPHKNEPESQIPECPEDYRATSEEIGSAPVQVPRKSEALRLIPDSGFLIPDPLSSVPNGTDASASRPPAEMTKDELWAAGKSLLAQGGMPAKQCGSFVGKLVKDFGDQVVIEAVRTAVVERPADPVGYLRAVCQRQAGQRQPVNKQLALEERNRAAMAEWLAQEGA